MMTNQNDLRKEILDWLAQSLSAGWVKPSLLKKIAKELKYTSSPSKYLVLSPEELKTRYREETLVSLQLGQQHFELPQALVFDNTDSKLPLNSFGLVLDQESPEYKIPPQIASKAEKLLNLQKKLQKRSLYDSTTTRLNRIEQFSTNVCLIVSKAHYFDYLATNFSMDAKLKGWKSSLRDTIHTSPRLCTLEESLLANHIGIGALVFTVDGFLVLPFRSAAGVNIYRQKIGPSISGASNFERDVVNALSGMFYPCLREGAEELGIETNDFDMSKTALLGITRELSRGGKPEVFFTTELRISATKLEARKKNAQSRHETSNIKLFEFGTASKEPIPESAKVEYYWSLLNNFLACLRQYGRQMSLPALTNLILWLKYKLPTREETS
ncbi:MAG: hypothetical protein ACWGMZ_05665 [Thermoguttaceae bacterium]